MKDILDKIKSHLEEMNNKKFINNLFILLLICIMLLVTTNIFLSPNKENQEYVIDEQPKEYNYSMENDYSDYLEKRLVNILSKLNGVGKVNVMITLEDSVEKVTAANTTTTTENSIENDSEGGTREVIREDLIIQVVTKGNNDELMVVKEVQPTVQGVIVVADGAEDPNIRETLYDAVKTVLGVKANKVQVYSSK